MSPENRNRLRKKLKSFDQYTLCGYITPAEYIYIIEKFNIRNDHWETYVRRQLKSGETRPGTYYFRLTVHHIDLI